MIPKKIGSWDRTYTINYKEHTEAEILNEINNYIGAFKYLTFYFEFKNEDYHRFILEKMTYNYYLTHDRVSYFPTEGEDPLAQERRLYLHHVQSKSFETKSEFILFIKLWFQSVKTHDYETKGNDVFNDIYEDLKRLQIDSYSRSLTDYFQSFIIKANRDLYVFSVLMKDSDTFSLTHNVSILGDRSPLPMIGGDFNTISKIIFYLKTWIKNKRCT